MGTNPAVHIANLYLLTYELEFMVRLLTSRRDDLRNVAQQFDKSTRRYIDDIFSLHNRFFDTYKIYDGTHPGTGFRFGIYPQYLTLNCEKRGSAVNFLNLFVYYDTTTSQLETTIYSKHNDPKYAALAFTKYPHMGSLLAYSCKLNIVTSQFIDYAFLCTKKDSFIYHAAHLLATLYITRSYPYPALISKAKNAIFRLLPLYGATRSQSILTSLRDRLQYILAHKYGNSHHCQFCDLPFTGTALQILNHEPFCQLNPAANHNPPL